MSAVIYLAIGFGALLVIAIGGVVVSIMIQNAQQRAPSPDPSRMEADTFSGADVADRLEKVLTSVKAHKASQKVSGSMFMLCFAGAGLVTIAISAWQWIRVSEAKDWPTTTGTVITSYVDSYVDDGDLMYEAEVVYNYTVGRTEYSSSRVIFFDYSSSSPNHATTICEKYPPGAIVPVYYNPNNPASAVLEPRTTFFVWIVFGMGLVFTAIGLGVGRLSITGAIKLRSKRQTTRTSDI